MSFETNRTTKHAFTLRELLVTLTTILLIVLIVAPGPTQKQIIYEQPITCADHLSRISQAVNACYEEHNGYGPTIDDGSEASFALTWTDLLYDMDYLPDTRYQICPADEHPDFPTEERAMDWRFYFVDHFGVGEPIKRGIRTSYALNLLLSVNFKQDRFEDASRQVYAMDGWWTWYPNMNAAWVLYEEVTGEPPPSPGMWPTPSATMQGWRHGTDHSANVLYFDGHVSLLTPHVPDDLEGLLTDTIDTTQAFTWLPGERNLRATLSEYGGTIEEHAGRRPYTANPEEGTYRRLDDQWTVPADYPEELHCGWRTRHAAWQRLPNSPRHRR